MKAENRVMSEDDIDGIRLYVLDALDKKAKVNWWDICKAVGETLGKQSARDAEQYLIDITNKTGLEVANASFGAGIKEVVEWGNETCPHDLFGEGTQCFERACDLCWQYQLRDWGLE